MKLFHSKISFYIQRYPSNFREKHLQTKEGRKKEGWWMLFHQGPFPSLMQGNIVDWHTGWLREEFPWSLQNLPRSKHQLCFALSPSLWSPPCQLQESCKPLPFSRASPAGTNQHWSHSQCHKAAESTSKQQETAKQHKAILQGHCLQHNEREQPGREIESQAVTNKDGFLQSPATVSAVSHNSLRNRSFLVFLVFFLVYGFPVADASSSRTKPVIKKCRTGKKIHCWPTQSRVFS